MNKYIKFFGGAALALAMGFSMSCSEEEPISLPPSFNLGEASNIMRTSATFSGSISGDLGSIESYGFEYSTSENFPGDQTWRTTLEGTATSNCTATIKGLEANERYYYRMFASTGVSTVYSRSEYFQTLSSSAPMLSALEVDSIGENTARFRCTVEDIGDEYLLEYGVGYKTSADKSYTPIPSDSIIPESIAGAANTFFVEITGLDAATKYQFRPYAKNSADANGDTGAREGYGTIIEETTEDQQSAVVTTIEIRDGNIGINSITMAGQVVSAAGSGGKVDACGFCWSETNTTPSIIDNHMEVDVPKNLKDYFTGTITDLQPGLTYYVRAYAQNTVDGSVKTGYGEVYEVVTHNIVSPSLEWIQEEDEWGYMNIFVETTPTSIRMKANIRNYDESALVEKGLIWDRSNSGITIEQARQKNQVLKIDVAEGRNVIDGTIKALEISAGYYVRAYAIYQAAGLEEVGYTGSHMLSTNAFETPWLDNVEVLDEKVTQRSAELVGKLASPGNGTITERGFCLTEISNRDENDRNYEPTLKDCHIIVKADESFIATVQNLLPNVEYAVRSYVISNLETKADTTYNGWRTCFWTKDYKHCSFDLSSCNSNFTSLELSFRIDELGDGEMIEQGFVWYEKVDENRLTPDIDNNTGKLVVTDGTEKGFSSVITGLKPATTYYTRAYIKMSIDGTEYIDYVGTWSFDTRAVPFNRDIVELTTNSCTIVGYIDEEISSSVSEYGFCWSTEQVSPSEMNQIKATKSNDSGEYTAKIENLTSGTNYYYSCYIVYDGKKIYSNVSSIFTTKYIPTVDSNPSPDKFD